MTLTAVYLGSADIINISLPLEAPKKTNVPREVKSETRDESMSASPLETSESDAVDLEQPGRPTWQDIPLELKLKLVQYLDHFARRNLRLCSSNERDIVDSCPIVISSFVIKSICNPNFVILSTLPKQLIVRYVPLSDIGDAFRLASEVPRLRIERLEVCHYAIPMLSHALQTLDSSKKITAYLVHIQGSGLFTSNHTVHFLSRLAGVKHILLDGRDHEQIFEQLVGLDQWKSASGIGFHQLNQLPIDPFLHLNSLKLNLFWISTADARRVVQNFLDKKSFQYRSTFFEIKTQQPMRPERILPNYSVLLNMTLKDPRSFERENVETRCWKFPKWVTESREFLVVKASTNFLKGVICRADFLNADFNGTPLI